MAVVTVELLRTTVAEQGTFRVPANSRRTRALLDLETVDDELSRRAAIGLGGVADYELLEVLRDLPVDIPVAETALEPWVDAKLRTAPAGCVDFADGAVIRRLVPAVRVISAGVCATRWSTALSRASQFGSYCTRYAVMTNERFDAERAVMEARFYGIGVATMTDGPDSFAWLLQPEPFNPTRHSAASWHFVESAVDALVQQRGTDLLPAP